MGGGAGLVTQFPEKWLQTANHPSRYILSQHVKWKPKILGFAGCCFRKENTSNNMGSLWRVRVGLNFPDFFCRPLGLKLQKKTHRLRSLPRHGFSTPKFGSKGSLCNRLQPCGDTVRMEISRCARPVVDKKVAAFECRQNLGGNGVNPLLNPGLNPSQC